MVDNLEIIYKKVVEAENTFKATDVNNLILWASKNLRDFCASDNYGKMNLMIIPYVLEIISNICYDIGPDEYLVSQDDLDNEKILRYFKEEFGEIKSYLTGEENFIHVNVIREKLLDKDNNLFKHIVVNGSLLLEDNYIKDNETIMYLKDSISKIKVSTRADIIYVNAVQTTLNLNGAVKHKVDKIPVAGYGMMNLDLLTQTEKRYLKFLIDVIKGEKAYKLSFGINKVTLLYANIQSLE